MESAAPVDQLRDEIVRLCSPREIVLFNQKQGPRGDLNAVKLCVIIEGGDSRQIEHRLYVEVDSEIPFDVLVYTADEWKQLLETEMSFATHIRKTGRVLYAAN